MKYIFLAGFILVSVFLFSCKKGAGQGGSSTIRGKVFQYNENANFTEILDSLYATKENVYIIYGDDVTYGDKLETNYDGTYEFRYLRKGKYKVFAYSRDSSKYPNSENKAVIVTSEITKNKQLIENPTINIIK